MTTDCVFIATWGRGDRPAALFRSKHVIDGRIVHGRDADPNRWGVSVCSTDGQRFDIGDVDDYFSIQSTSKVVTFAMALAEVGEKETLSYVGAASTTSWIPPPDCCLEGWLEHALLISSIRG